MSTAHNKNPFLALSAALRNTLTASDQQKLSDAMMAAQKSQEAEYWSAFDKALSHVPALLRGPVRKIIKG